MRSAAVASISIFAAVLGGAVALLAGKAFGWVGRSSERTVVVTETAPAVGASAPAAVGTAAGALVGKGFDPARIYALRAPGVVTIYSFFGSPAGG